MSNATTGPSDSTARSVRAWVRERGVLRYHVVLAVAFVVLVLSGTTLSSLGDGAVRDDGTAPGRGLVAGTPRDIRSDEFLRTTPWRLGALDDPDLSFASPLAEDGAVTTTIAHHGVASRLVFFDSLVIELGRAAPHAMVHALLWWLPTFLFLAAAPLLLVGLGAPRPVARTAVGLALLSPAVAWWSLGPVGSGLGYATAAGALVLAAGRRLARGAAASRRDVVVGVGCILAAGPLVARVPFAYAPWSLVLASCVLVPAFAALAATHGVRTLVRVGGAVVAWTGLLALAVLVENRHALAVLGDTVYPGRRREAATALDLARLFGAPHLAALRGAGTVTNANASEISSAYLVLLVPVALVAVAAGRAAARTLRASLLAMSLVVGTWFAWIAVDAPRRLGRAVPVLDLSQPERTGQVLGIAATLLFGLALARLVEVERATRTRVALGAAVLTFFLLSMAGATLADFYLPGLSPWRVLATSGAFAAAVGVACAFATRAWAGVPLLALALWATWFVNPVQVGLGDLDGGAAAAAVRALHDAAPAARFASDGTDSDALLMANAIPSLSGQQWVGPDEDAWHVLDPDDAARDAWNRGASFLRFSWAAPPGGLRIFSPAADIVVVEADPCDARLGRLGLRYVVSTSELGAGCLLTRTTFTFGGLTRYVYERG